ncbi:MAG: hypothetical protein ACR2PT_15000 [Endozoicomonas sp.]
MMKMMFTLLVLIAVFLAVTDNQELSVSSNHFYFRAEFPRSVEPPWYVIELGKKPGLGKVIKQWRSAGN